MLYAFQPLIYLPVTFLRRVVFGRDACLRQYFFDKWGFIGRSVDAVVSGGYTVWIDGASGGEVLQLVSFVKKLKARCPGLKIVFSTASDDAFCYARKLPEIDFVFNTPWDFAFVASRVIRRIKPKVFLTVEFSRIPMHFKAAQAMGVRTVLLSGLMSCDFTEHPTMRRAFALKYYRYFDFIGAKEERDKQGFLALGVPESKVRPAGNLKFDLENLSPKAGDLKELAAAFNISSGEKIFLAASVFPPEERIAIEAYALAKKEIAGLRLIIAPRFNKYIPGIKEELEKRGIRFLLRSRLKDTPAWSHEAIILDTFGELMRVYHLADCIFLSGSIFPVNKIGGGKNIVEPLVSGKPILFGPHMNYWREITAELKSVFEGCEVRGAGELARAIVKLENNPDIAARLSRKSAELLAARSHIVDDNVAFVGQLLNAKRS